DGIRDRTVTGVQTCAFRSPGANWIASVTFPPPTSTVPCTKSGGFATPADATASPTGSVTSVWKELGDDGAVVELGPLLPHAAARKTIAASPASLTRGGVMVNRDIENARRRRGR